MNPHVEYIYDIMAASWVSEQLQPEQAPHYCKA